MPYSWGDTGENAAKRDGTSPLRQRKQERRSEFAFASWRRRSAVERPIARRPRPHLFLWCFIKQYAFRCFCAILLKFFSGRCVGIRILLVCDSRKNKWPLKSPMPWLYVWTKARYVRGASRWSQWQWSHGDVRYSIFHISPGNAEALRWKSPDIYYNSDSRRRGKSAHNISDEMRINALFIKYLVNQKILKGWTSMERDIFF